jgi:hypothetical protein
LKFKSCNINWGTVLAGEQKTEICGVNDPDFDGHDGTNFRVIATQNSGNLGLTVLQATYTMGFDFGQVTMTVAKNTPNDLNAGIVNYNLMIFLLCTDFPTLC